MGLDEGESLVEGVSSPMMGATKRKAPTEPLCRYLSMSGTSAALP